MSLWIEEDLDNISYISCFFRVLVLCACPALLYEVSVICQNENTGAVKVPFFDFGEIVETKLRSQAEKKNLISSFNSHHLIVSDEGVMCKSDF